MPPYLTRTDLKKQRLEETRAKFPTKFHDAYSLLYGSGGGNENVAKAISIAPSGRNKSLSENDDQLRQECCKECGQDHSFRPTFEGVKTSIDMIPKMLRRQQPLKET